MHFVDVILKLVGYALTMLYAVCFVMVPLSGFRMRGSEWPPSSRLDRHRRWVHRSWIATAVLIAALEALLLPRFGRHYDILTYWHWSFDAIFFVFWPLARIYTGLRARLNGTPTMIHAAYGYITSFAALCAAVSGTILIHRLR